MTGRPTTDLGAATIAVRGGVHPSKGEGITPPIHLTSTFVLPGDPGPGDLTYGRGHSPAFEPLEAAIAALEGANHGIVFNAGVAATCAVLEEAGSGGALVMPADVYYGF